MEKSIDYFIDQVAEEKSRYYCLLDISAVRNHVKELMVRQIMGSMDEKTFEKFEIHAEE